MSTSKSSILKDIVNKNLQTMFDMLKTRPNRTNCFSEQTQNETTVLDTKFRNLANGTLSAIYELEKVEKSKVVQLKIDKALLTLITRLVEFGLYTDIIEPLQKLRSRLLIYFKPTNISGIKTVDSKQAVVHLELLMRIISKAINGLHDSTVRSALVFQELNAFYDEMLILVEKYIYNVTENPKFLIWRNHYSYVARKSNNCKKSLEFYESIISSLQESSQYKHSAQDLGNLLQIADLRIEIAHFALQNLICTKQTKDTIKRIKEAQFVFNELSKSNLMEKLSKKEISALSQLFKVVELIREPIIKIVEFIASQEFNEESVCTCLKDLIQAISICFNLICENYFVEYKSHYLREKDSTYLNPENIVQIIIDIYDVLSQLEFNLYQQNGYKNCMSYIDQAYKIVQHTSCREGLHSILRAYCRIGNFYYKSGEYKKATKAFEKSLRYIPQRDFLQFSKLVSSQTVLSASQKLPLIPNIIDRYINSTYINCPDGEFTSIQDIFLDAGCNLIDSAGLLEYELRVLKERILTSRNIQFDFLNVEKSLIDTLLSCYLPEEFPIRRARILIEKVKIMICIESDSGQGSALKFIEGAIDLLKTDNFGKDNNLGHLCSYYLAAAYSLTGILTLDSENLSNDSFESAFIIWDGILKNIPPYKLGCTIKHKHIEIAKEKIDEIERLYGHLQLLVDFFGVTNQPSNKIKTLNIMLSLNNGIRDTTDKYSDSVILYAQIGQMYLNLGYTGRAGMAFERAKDILDSNTCLNEARLSWMLGYSHYLCAIGYMDKRNAQKDPVVAARLARQRKNEQMLLVDASYTRSRILIRLGRLENAISDVTQAIHLLNRMMRNVNLNGKHHYHDKVNAEVNPFLVENNVTNKCSTGINGEFFGGFLNLTAQRWKWRVLQMLFECNHHLGQLHILRGSAKEADYCFQQAFELIQSTKAKTNMSRVLLNFAELEFRRHCWKESEEKINQVIEYQRKAIIFRKEEVLAKLCFGDFKYREGDFKFRQGDFDNQKRCYEFALEYYSKAVDILTNIMKEEYISKIEHLDTSVLQTPRSKKFISYSDTPKDKFTGKADYECCLLAYLKSELFRRQGLILSKRGKIEEGLRLIEHEKLMNQTCLEKAEHLLILSKVKMLEITAKLTNQNHLLYENSCRVKQSMTLTTLVIIEEIDKTLECLMEVYDLAYECGPTHLLQETSLCISTVTMIKAYGQSQLNIDQSEMATICAFYLEMTKALTAKREFYTALNEKCKDPFLCFDNQWPQKISTLPSESDILQNEDEYQLYDDETVSRRSFLTALTQRYKNEPILTYNEFQKEFLDILPPNWTVCSVSVDIETNDMYICRYQRKMTPLLLRLPLKRQSSRDGESDVFSYKEAIREFNAILDLCNQIMSNPSTSKEWWKTRKGLDVRLKHLLYNIENLWLGGFKGILMADKQQSSNRILKFKEKIDSLLFKCESGKSSRKRSKVKKLDIEIELCKSFLRLGSDAQDQDIEDILYFLVDAYNKYNDQQVGYDEIDLDQLIIDVQDALSCDDTMSSNVDDQHVILILDKYVQMLPWESLPCLRSQAVSRLPSLSFLRDRIMLTNHVNNKQDNKQGWLDYVIDQHKSFYVLNPSQDLKHTQNEFEGFVKNIKGSDGITGRIPTDQEWIDGLANKDLFMYFGHGAGEAYCKKNKLRHLDRCAVTLLFGCSSGQLKLGGEFDPSGIILSYLLAGSPAIVANLWDVTDVDFDRFSKSLFRNWGLNPNGETTISKKKVSLVQAVTIARNACKLKYLIGSAPVVYGIPCYLQSK
ncbi:10891_t:CDS:10 [Funneliformis mosseae]|uniref:separase n=1 Tax=Funneliformis mosseae TaxID=27381 RepID=A0A9N8ZTC3_FUNMO|nr:10891_t:CDS:10 [Funneliformis mosseae]